MSEELHATVDGPADAPVLLLGSSLGTTGAMWEPQLAGLTGLFRVVRYDHRGHGGSPVPAGPYRLADLAGDVLALADRLGVARFCYAGLSLGGMVGMELAAQAPDRVDRMALLCTSALLGPPEFWTARADAARAGGTASIADTVVSRWFRPDFVAANPDLYARYQRMCADTPAEGYAGCCEAIRDMDLTGRLGAIRSATLVLAGADDPATPPSHAELIAAGIDGARVVVVDGAAHLANVERPAEVTDLLVTHLCPDRGV
ncbi:MAG TPA: 3-oxoadipate enol-lactonase [Mycobacteriales bacterium]|nr:3-oxoadipate enol-lactonase [Mycobacteriales bacterium]